MGTVQVPWRPGRAARFAYPSLVAVRMKRARLGRSGTRLPARSAVLAMLLVVTSCSSGTSTADAPVEPALVPTAASVSDANSALDLSFDAALSPTGEARVASAFEQWCLEDANGVRCVNAEAMKSSAHGIVWRPNETAIAVTDGGQGPISIIDFDAGTSIETSISQHRILAWSPDGSQLLGMDLSRPSELVVLDPVSLEADKFADLPGALVPELRWATDEIVWGSTPDSPEVFTFSKGQEPKTIEGGLGEQRLGNVTANAQLVIATDVAVDRGRGGPDDTALRIFDRAERRSVGVQLPSWIPSDGPHDAVLSPDGRVLLVVHNTEDRDLALSSATIDAETLEAFEWTNLVTWTQDAPLQPRRSAANGIIQWDGGDTAWILGEGAILLKVSLS